MSTVYGRCTFLVQCTAFEAFGEPEECFSEPQRRMQIEVFREPQHNATNVTSSLTPVF